MIFIESWLNIDKIYQSYHSMGIGHYNQLFDMVSLYVQSCRWSVNYLDNSNTTCFVIKQYLQIKYHSETNVFFTIYIQLIYLMSHSHFTFIPRKVCAKGNYLMPKLLDKHFNRYIRNIVNINSKHINLPIQRKCQS